MNSTAQSPQEQQNRNKVTILDIQTKKDNSIPISMLTAYDYSSALLVDQAGTDIILVGDSLGNVMLGLDSTVPVTMEEMLHHCRAVKRGARFGFLVGDMPFMSYQADISEAIRNAGRFLKEGYMDSVKLEGGSEVAKTISAIVQAGIPVMGHIGLTPQSVSKLGGYKVQGKTAGEAMRLLDDALAIEAAGCYSIVLEAVPHLVAEKISQELTIPTIGIGAGKACDGQVLVYHDVIGLFDKFTPKFVKQYANMGKEVSRALDEFIKDVSDRTFPGPEHSYTIADSEYTAFLEMLRKGEGTHHREK